jgi:Uma2 family endonuclease
MTNLALDWPRFTVSQYEALLKDSAIKLEYVDGVVYAMAGTSNWHNMLALNLCGALNTRLPDRCRALGLDVQLAVKTATSERHFFPDTFVTCGDFGLRTTYDDALIVAEVLSPSTESYDRNAKMLSYCGLAGLQEYLLLLPDEPTIEVYRRADGWKKTLVRGSVDLDLTSISLAIPLTEIYRRVPVDFTPST